LVSEQLKDKLPQSIIYFYKKRSEVKKNDMHIRDQGLTLYEERLQLLEKYTIGRVKFKSH